MGSSSKKHKDSKRKRHRSRSDSNERDVSKEKKHRHRKHHKDRKRERLQKHEYESDDSDVIEVSSSREITPPPPSLSQSTKSDSPEPTGQSTDSLSIEETNKLRAKLGLKPLEVKATNSKDGKKKDDLGEFYHKPATNIADKQKQEKLKSKLSEHKEKRNLENKLSKVKLLAASDSEDDVSSWVQRNRKVENAKRDAQKRAQMLEELDAQFGIGEIIEEGQRQKRNKKYTEKHLKGLQVDHNIDNFQEGRSVVLTLKDSEILGEGEDVLVNVNMLDDERYKKNSEIRKKKTLYNAYDVEEVDEFGNLKEKALLSKYDEEIEGEKRENFKIGHDNAAERRQAITQSIKEKLNAKRLETLSDTYRQVASDYYNENEMAQFKKPKKKGKKMRGKSKLFTADDLENVTSNKKPSKHFKAEDMIIDDTPDIPAFSDIKVEEKDDILERALHKARKLKQREQVANDLISSVVANIKPEEPVEENSDFGNNIVLNATAEFCRTLGDIPTYGRAGNREDGEDLLDFEKEVNSENMIDDDDDIEMMDEGGHWNVVNLSEKKEPQSPPNEVQILDEEPDVGSGVSAALKLAMSKGYLDKEQNNRPSNSRLAHLQAQHYSIEDKSYGDDNDRGRRERYTGPIQEFRERDCFKPNVKLEYIDDDGRVLNSKEAFRYLSHKFHGKGPGKNKVEKRIKKNVQEGLMKKMSSTDTPLGTLNMLQAKQKELQSPYIVLSGSKHTHSTIISKARR